jgi:hypothetical protein
MRAVVRSRISSLEDIKDGDWQPDQQTMEVAMLIKTKIALAAAFILGTASGVLANDNDSNDKGGFVIPGSTDGVNPAFHRDDPAVVQSPRQPEKGIQTEGRASPERLPPQKEQKPINGQADEGEKGKWAYINQEAQSESKPQWPRFGGVIFCGSESSSSWPRFGGVIFFGNESSSSERCFVRASCWTTLIHAVTENRRYYGCGTTGAGVCGRGAGATGAVSGAVGTGARMFWPEVVAGAFEEVISVLR